MTTDAFARLRELLRTLFQFESKDLDFGIYRIMFHKRAEIEDFIHNGLAEMVDDALKGGAVARQAAQTEELRQATDRVREDLGEYAIGLKGDLDERFRETRIGKEYLEARSRAGEAVDLEDLKATIFNHVYTFFSRYYDNGDFLSRRRYSRRHKYAVPYNGEEVHLHWANAGQYYVKTGEHFSDYRYRSGGVNVHFELTAADTEQNNVKGERRFFVPRVRGASYDGRSKTLTIPFEYRPLTTKEGTAYGTRNQQEKIIEEATADLPARLRKHPAALAALEPASELERHLRRYTRRNTSDFFIHKDLKGFLEGELDFYLKNEVLDVDDLEAWGPERSESWFEVMRAVKAVGRGVVAFLAQIEDFQKRLFEKKKFVVSAGYCITLERVPEELYPGIAASDAQREEWVRLFAIDGIEENLTEPGYSEPLTTDFLKANPFLVLDTRHFDEDFEDRLLASIEDLDETTDGLLIESENFQALNLLQERYREQVKCIYIDPPYNTGGDGFLYKDSYQHSSWLSMMENRLLVSCNLLDESGVFFSSINDIEQDSLKHIANTIFSREGFIGQFVWKSRQNKDDRTITGASIDHEYVLCYGDRVRGDDRKLEQYSNPDNDPRGDWASANMVGLATEERRPNLHYDLVDPSTGINYGKPKLGWRYDKATMARLIEENKILWPSSPEGRPRRKMFKSELKEEFTGYSSLIATDIFTRDGTADIQALFGERVTAFPKPAGLIQELVVQGGAPNGTMLDFFAGSGTTGHAVIDLNREDGGNRKYILVEMGEYFDTVLKPRILKVIYSKDWRDGRPVSREGTSHALKYMKLESYEDALDNIAFTHEEAGQEALALYGDDYLLRYMLDFETRGSATLLNVEKLAAPFRYKLRLRGSERGSERGGEEKRAVSVDLPETFAYLLGLRVRSRKAYHDGGRRYLVHRGSTPERGEVAAIWRDTENWTGEDYERDRDFVAQNALAAGADEVFVNGDSFIPEARPLEGVFKRLMLAEPENGR